MSRFYCTHCESPTLLPKDGICNTCKKPNHLATIFSRVIVTTQFKNLYGDWFFKIDEIRGRNERTNSIENIPADEIVYI